MDDLYFHFCKGMDWQPNIYVLVGAILLLVYLLSTLHEGFEAETCSSKCAQTHTQEFRECQNDESHEGCLTFDRCMRECNATK